MMIYGPQRPIPAGFAQNSWYNMLFLTDATTRRLAYIPSVASTVFGYDENNLPSMLTLAQVAWTGQYADLLGLPTLGTAAASASTDFATAAQGATADSALQSSAIGVSIEAHSTNLDNLGANAPAYYLSRANQTGTQLASTISDFSAASLLAVTWSTITGKPTFGTASAQNTSAFDASGAATTAQAFAIQRANHTGTQLASTISDFSAAALLAVTWTTLTGKPTFATVATTGAYSDLSGKPTIPAAQVNSDWNSSSGLSQILNKPTIPAAQIQADWNEATSSALDFIKNKPSIPAAQVNSDWNAVSGLAQILNKPTIPTIVARVFSTPTFSSITTATQLSSTRDAEVWYDIDASVTISILAGQSVTATLTYADNSAMTTNPVVVSSQLTSNSGLLGLTQANTLKVGGFVPAGKYRKVTFAVTNSATTPTALKAGQEVLQ